MQGECAPSTPLRAVVVDHDVDTPRLRHALPGRQAGVNRVVLGMAIAAHQDLALIAKLREQAGERRRAGQRQFPVGRSEEHTSELQSLMRISYAVFCLKKKKKHTHTHMKQTT